MKLLLNIVASIRRSVPYGFLKNWTCSIESAIEVHLVKNLPNFTIPDLIRRSGGWWGGKIPPSFSVKDFIRFMESHGIDYPRSK